MPDELIPPPTPSEPGEPGDITDVSTIENPDEAVFDGDASPSRFRIFSWTTFFVLLALALLGLGWWQFIGSKRVVVRAAVLVPNTWPLISTGAGQIHYPPEGVVAAENVSPLYGARIIYSNGRALSILEDKVAVVDVPGPVRLGTLNATGDVYVNGLTWHVHEEETGVTTTDSRDYIATATITVSGVHYVLRYEQGEPGRIAGGQPLTAAALQDARQTFAEILTGCAFQ